MFKHSKVLNLSLQIRQGGEEKQSKLQKFLETGVKFGVTAGARHVQKQKVGNADKEGGTLPCDACK